MQSKELVKKEKYIEASVRMCDSQALGKLLGKIWRLDCEHKMILFFFCVVVINTRGLRLRLKCLPS